MHITTSRRSIVFEFAIPHYAQPNNEASDKQLKSHNLTKQKRNNEHRAIPQNCNNMHEICEKQTLA